MEKATHDLVMSYIKEETTIILCVIAASSDIVTSQAIKMAEKVDPK